MTTLRAQPANSAKPDVLLAYELDEDSYGPASQRSRRSAKQARSAKPLPLNKTYFIEKTTYTYKCYQPGCEDYRQEVHPATFMGRAACPLCKTPVYDHQTIQQVEVFPYLDLASAEDGRQTISGLEPIWEEQTG